MFLNGSCAYLDFNMAFMFISSAFGLFGLLVVWQAVGNKYGGLKPSTFLVHIRDCLTSAFEWIGYQFGYWFNLYEWWIFFREWMRPIFDAMQDIVEPFGQIMFSWVYFFVGFAKNHMIAFAVLGSILPIGLLLFYFQSFFLQLATTVTEEVLKLCITLAIVISLIGIQIFYPSIWPKLFPRLFSFIQETNAEVRKYNTKLESKQAAKRRMRGLTVPQLKDYLDELGVDRSRARYRHQLVDLAVQYTMEQYGDEQCSGDDE
jgi:hypothetical protein